MLNVKSRKFVRLSFIFLLTGSLALLYSCASEKIAKRSHKSQPSWLYGMVPGYFITSGTGSSFEEAQKDALVHLKDQVIQSIAVQVVSKTQSNTRESFDTEIADYLSTYENNIEVYSEYFEPLKGISASKVEDFYWHRYKETGKNMIRYHIKYPFSDVQLKSLISDFEALEAEMESKLLQIEKNGEHYESAEEIVEDIRNIDELITMLPRSKRQRALVKKESLEETLDDISFIVLGDSSGYLLYELRLYGDPIQVMKAPDIFASCDISIREFKSFKFQNIIVYDRSDCVPGKDEKLTVQYKFGDQQFKSSFLIPSPESYMKKPDIRYLEIESTGLGMATLRIDMSSKDQIDMTLRNASISFYPIGRPDRRTRIDLQLGEVLKANSQKRVRKEINFDMTKSIRMIGASFGQNQFKADVDLYIENRGNYHYSSLPLRFSL